MTRSAILRTSTRILRSSSTTTSFAPATVRSLSMSSVRFGEGDTGSTRTGGAAQGDAFTKREQANEDFHVRQREMEKLQALKEKIASHQKHLSELSKNVDDQISGAGGKKGGGS